MVMRLRRFGAWVHEVVKLPEYMLIDNTWSLECNWSLKNARLLPPTGDRRHAITLMSLFGEDTKALTIVPWASMGKVGTETSAAEAEKLEGASAASKVEGDDNQEEEEEEPDGEDDEELDDLEHGLPPKPKVTVDPALVLKRLQQLQKGAAS